MMAVPAKRPCLPRRDGFTLLELVLSVAILAMIALLLARVFSESTRAIGQGKGQAMLDETARMLLDYIEQDVGQALVRTNVAFRVSTTTDPRDTLYFVSTGMRRQHERIPRDTAPMRIYAKNGGTGWSRALAVQSPNDASGNTPLTRENLEKYSDYYFTSMDEALPDFGGASSMVEGEYTEPLGSTLEDHAVLTFLEFTVNGDPIWTSNPAGPPDPNDMPRFVDVSLGLVSSAELRIAEMKNSMEHVEAHERTYSRRVFLRNTGIDQLGF